MVVHRPYGRDVPGVVAAAPAPPAREAGVAVSSGGGGGSPATSASTMSASEASSSPLVGMMCADSDSSSTVPLSSPPIQMDSPNGQPRDGLTGPTFQSSSPGWGTPCGVAAPGITLSWSDLTYTLLLPASARRAAARAAAVRAARTAASATAAESGELLPPPVDDAGGAEPDDSDGVDVDSLDEQEARDGVRHILRGVSGRVASGQVLAIMGPSGCGKTTLLNMLAGRVAKSRTHLAGGVVRVDGVRRAPGSFRRLAAYVAQDDVLFGELTVREHIAFAASLRVGTLADVAPVTSGLLSELRLGHVADSRIGSPLVRGVSGGERKRTAIAMELVAAPPLVFLDEPTSAVDAANALVVADSLVSLAAGGRAVVTTIHQPRSDIFARFDLLMLLARGGDVAYFGPAADVVSYFAGLSLPCPERVNPADFIVDLVSVRPPGAVSASSLSSSAASAGLSPSSADISCSPSAAATAVVDEAVVASANLQLILKAGKAQQLAVRASPNGPASPTIATTEVSMSPSAAIVDAAGALPVGSATSQEVWSAGGIKAAVGRLFGRPVAGVTIKRRARMAANAAAAGGATDGAGSRGLHSGASSPTVVLSRHRVRPDAAVDALAEEPDVFVPWTRQFGTLLRRSAVLNLRERTFNRSRLAQAVVVSSFTGVTFYKVGASRTGSVDDIIIVGNVLAMVIVSQLMTATTGLALSFPTERAIMLRERASGSYGVSAYILAKTLAEGVRNSIFSLLFSAIIYFLLGLKPTVASFGIFAATLLATSMMGESVGLVAASAVSSIRAVAVLMPLSLAAPLLYSGAVLPRTETPVFLRWAYSVSYVSYAFSALLKNQFGGLLFERPPFTFSAGVMTGEDALLVWQAKDLSIGTCVGVVCAQALAFRLIAYAVLRRRGPRFDVSV
ncbi:hypothetical protein MMPV_002448 [Pyropia vietnamensis]